MQFQTFGAGNGQRGMALIIAIGFLAILSILGAVVLDVSTRDLGLSGSFMPARQAFYASDRAVEYAMNRDIIINLNPGETVDLKLDDALDNTGTSLGKTHKQIIDAMGDGTLEEGSVGDLGPHDLPPTMAEIHGTDFGANLYHVEVEATAAGGMVSRVDASIVRLFKLDDDTIFRTSGGG